MSNKSDDDFLTQLNNIHHGNIADNHQPDHDAKCLISLNELEPDFIELDCHHKYNYVPLFTYLYRTKQRICLYGIECPYCTCMTYNTMPVRKVGDKYWDDTQVTLPIENAIGKDHKCQVCQTTCVSGYCVRHSKYLAKVVDDIDDARIMVLNTKVNNRFTAMIGRLKDGELGEIADNLLLDALDVPILKKICKQCCNVAISKLSKYELISLIKSVYD